MGIKSKINKITKSLKNITDNILYPEIGEIIMLHRVVHKESKLTDNRLLEITPEVLENKILEYIAKGYRFASIDDIYSQIQQKKRFKKKFVNFSFDDGYNDIFKFAYPILKKYNCPFTVYIATDFPNYNAILWWYILEGILLKNNQLILNDGVVYNCETEELKNKTFREIRNKIFSLQNINLKDTINNLFKNYDYSITNIAAKNLMNWEQILILSQDQLCTIGSHSVTHGYLSNMSYPEIEFEIAASQKVLEARLNKRIVHFAFPYGNFNEESIRALKKYEYKTSVMAWGGKVHLNEDCFKIKRISLEK